MESFIRLKKLIDLTPNYPKEGIEFIDLSRALAHPDAMVLARIACANLCIDSDCVLVGIPTRGCLVTQLIAVASGRNPSVVQLQKQGVGTPLPGAIPLCSGGTVYSSNATTFLVDEASLALLKKARRVILCDDIHESGKTMDAIQDAICFNNPSLSVSFSDRLSIPDLIRLAFVEVVSTSKAMVFGLLQKKGNGHDSIQLGHALRIRQEELTTLRGCPSVPRGACEAVYGPPSMRPHIISYVNAHRWSFVGDVVWGAFPGGAPHIQYKDYADHGGAINILFFYDASSENVQQNYMVRELARGCTRRMKIVVLYMPQATMERADTPGTLVTAKSFLDVLCADLPIVEGRIEVEVLDIHQTSEGFYVPSNVRFTSRSILPSLVPDQARIVAFPDDGAFKRFGHAFRGFTQVVCMKKRDGNKREITLRSTIGPLSVSGNAVFIVDDLVRTGGTIRETATALRTMGASVVHVVFVHADFEPGRTHEFARCSELDTITCTDSCWQKAYALFMLGGSERVNIHSALTGERIIMRLNNPPLMLVASENDAKRIAAFNLLTHRCENKCLKMDEKPPLDVRGIITVSVESGVSEQPFGDEEGLRGAKNRLAYAMQFGLDVPTVAFESFMRETNQFVDTVCAIMAVGKGCDPLRESYYEYAIPPQDIARKAKEEGKLVGELLMNAFNLASKDAWIDYFAANRGSRIQQLEIALYWSYAKAYPQKCMPTGGR